MLVTVKMGPYELVDRIGTGAMGEVWRARDARLHRDVAVKILPRELAHDSSWKERFLREARIAARLNHPNIVTIYSVADSADTMYIAMELVEGRDLSELIEDRSLTVEDVCRIGIDVAAALHEAHRAGIVHRDVKPANIILGRRGVKVLDFGLAKDPHVIDGSPTVVNTILGTPLYMSPEQAMGRPLDARSDIFSLGATLYEALSGYPPFAGDTVQTTLLNVVSTAHQPLRGTPRELNYVIDRCLQKSPANRFSTAFDVAEALSSVQLPAEEPVEKATQPTVRLAHVKPHSRALVVDDDELVRIILHGTLVDAGFEVDEAENGAEAIRHLKESRYDAMFLDLLMPRVDGWTVLDFLRKSGRRPRNVYITSGVRDLKLSVADASVVTDILNKPIKPAFMMQLAAELTP